MDEKVKLIEVGLRVMDIQVSKDVIEKILRLNNVITGSEEVTLQDCININDLVNKKIKK